jgi:hypothetical protein
MGGFVGDGGDGENDGEDMVVGFASTDGTR